MTAGEQSAVSTGVLRHRCTGTAAASVRASAGAASWRGEEQGGRGGGEGMLALAREVRGKLADATGGGARRRLGLGVGEIGQQGWHA